MTSAPSGSIRFWLKGYLFLGVAVLTLAMLIYSNHLIARMRENSEATSRLFSRYMGTVIFEVTEEGRMADLREVINESDLPIIITVADGVPLLSSNVSVPERTAADLDMLEFVDVDNPPNEKFRKLVKLYREFDHTN